MDCSTLSLTLSDGTYVLLLLEQQIYYLCLPEWILLNAHLAYVTVSK